METITRISERRSIATDVTAQRETPTTLAATATDKLAAWDAEHVSASIAVASQ